MPRISIVLPTYNGKRYLRQAVDSILAQTYTDWELILVDDCSKDGTADIVEEYAATDSRIHAIHNKENKKLPGALNVGFSIAKGCYLTWTSDDNLYEENALSVMADYLDMHGEAYMVRGRMQYINEEGTIIGQGSIYNDKKMYVYNCVGACFMYRKEVRDTIGDYDVNTFCVEDYDYWLRVLGCFGKISPIAQVLYRYRVHGNSLTALKKQQVQDQLTRLRIRYADIIFENLREYQQGLYEIYFEMRKSKYMTHEMTERFMEQFPALRKEVPLAANEKYIIFGAGIRGEEAAHRLGKKAFFFTDSDSKKVGNMKCGLKILSFHDAVKLSKEYHFLVAAAGIRSYEMIEQLQKAGVKEYSIFEV